MCVCVFGLALSLDLGLFLEQIGRVPRIVSSKQSNPASSSIHYHDITANRNRFQASLAAGCTQQADRHADKWLAPFFGRVASPTEDSLGSGNRRTQREAAKRAN